MGDETDIAPAGGQGAADAPSVSDIAKDIGSIADDVGSIRKEVEDDRKPGASLGSISAPEQLARLAQVAITSDVGKTGRSADRLADNLEQQLATNPEFADALRKSPQLVRGYADVAKVATDADTVTNYHLEVAKSNSQLYMRVVNCVGASLVIVVVAIAVISLYQINLVAGTTSNMSAITINIPDGLIALGSAAIGALAGLLTPLNGR